jgi:hypothetical protein
MLSCGRTLAAFLLVAVLFDNVGCRRTPGPEEARRLLAGKWRLVSRHDCKHWGVDSTLILHAGGRLEQHLKLLNGKTYDSVQERWEFIPDHSVSLDRRLTVTDPQYAGIPESEVLIVEFTEPPAILLNPDQDCLYERFSSEE